VAYSGNPQDFGQQNDPMVGKPIGGVIVFGGGLPLYSNKGELVGGLGVSGDTSCADHGVSNSGFGHPACKGGKPAEDIIQKLSQSEPVGPKH
jgi:hypothetical protein